MTEAVETGEPQAAVDELQAQADESVGQRDTMFKGETLRGLLLSAFAWSTVGVIAGYAAIGAFIAAGMMAVLGGARVRPPAEDTSDDLIVAPEPNHPGPRCLPRGTAPGTCRVRWFGWIVRTGPDSTSERLLDAVLTIGSDLDLHTVLHTIIQTAPTRSTPRTARSVCSMRRAAGWSSS